MLKPTDHYAKITWLGVVPPGGGLRSTARDTLTLTLDGPEGEAHSGRTRPACTRVRRQYPKGTEIANTRQLTVLSREEMAIAAEAMGVAQIDPEWAGATMIVEGIPDFTLIPPSSRLIFENGTSIVNDIENAPCAHVGAEIEKEHPGKGEAFPKAAWNKRGICAWVERAGTVTIGMTARLHIPPQRIWAHG